MASRSIAQPNITLLMIRSKSTTTRHKSHPCGHQLLLLKEFLLVNANLLAGKLRISDIVLV